MSFAYNPVQLSGGGGGGGSGSGRITVGASGTYQSLTAAIGQGERVLSVISDVTEGNVVVTVPLDGLTITIDANADLNMGSGYFYVGDSYIHIDGAGRLLYDTDDANYVLFDGETTGKVVVSNITILNGSSVPACLTDTSYARFYDVIFDGDVKICGDANIYEGCIYRNSTIIVASGVDNAILDGSIFESVVVSDSGTNTVISDSVVY